MRFAPHTTDDTVEMLRRIGVPDVDALFDQIPPGSGSIGPSTSPTA